MTLQTLNQPKVKKETTAVSVRYEYARVVQTRGQSNVNSIPMERLVFTSWICGVPYVTASPWRLCHHLEKEETCNG